MKNSSVILHIKYLYDSNGQRLLKLKVMNSTNQTAYYIGDSFVHIINASGKFNQTFYYADGVLLAENGIGWMSTDWVAVRHFVFPKPTYVIGNEQMFSNSCSCPSINTNWDVALNEYCIINTACEIGSGNITFTGSGNFTCNANINASNLDDPGNNNVVYIASACRMSLN